MEWISLYAVLVVLVLVEATLIVIVSYQIKILTLFNKRYSRSVSKRKKKR